MGKAAPVARLLRQDRKNSNHTHSHIMTDTRFPGNAITLKLSIYSSSGNTGH